MIQVKGLEFSYDKSNNKIPVLRGIDLSVNKGEFVALLGANGSGKSTLGRHLNGLLKPDQGSVLIDGIDTKDDNKKNLLRQKVGYLFQNPENQLVAPTVGEDVAFGPENYCLSSDEIKQRVLEALDLVAMRDYINHPLQFLSGGQKQSVALAGILANRPDCLILDEPTSMLDPLGRGRVLGILSKLKVEGYTIIYITHSLEEALLADRIIILEQGQIALQGLPREVVTSKKLTSFSLQIPPFYKLITELRQNGLDIPDYIFTVDELVYYLCS